MRDDKVLKGVQKMEKMIAEMKKNGTWKHVKSKPIPVAIPFSAQGHIIKQLEIK